VKEGALRRRSMMRGNRGELQVQKGYLILILDDREITW